MTNRQDAERAGHDPSVNAPPPSTEKASLFEDFIDIFYAPSNVFARRERSGYWAHFFIISGIAAIFAFASRSLTAAVFDAEYTRNIAKVMEKNPQVTQEMLASQRGIMEGVSSVGIYLATPLLILFAAILIWFGAKVASASISFDRAMLIGTLAQIPRLLGSLLTTVQGLLVDTATIDSMHDVGYSPARFMDPDSMPSQVLGLIARFDVFTLWVTFLLAVGVAVIAKVPRSKGYAAAAIAWAIPSLIAIVPLIWA